MVILMSSDVLVLPMEYFLVGLMLLNMAGGASKAEAHSFYDSFLSWLFLLSESKAEITSSRDNRS